MNVQEIRSSFTIYLIASADDHVKTCKDALQSSGYMVAHFRELAAAISEIPSNPPHFLIFDFVESQFELTKAVKHLASQLPESHVFVLAPLNQRESAVKMLEQGVYDIVYTPLASPLEILSSLDRAADRDYFMYLNEQQDSPPADPVPLSAPELLESPYVDRLFAEKTADGCFHVFLQEVSNLLNGSGVVQFKWIPNRRVLMAASALELAKQ